MAQKKKVTVGMTPAGPVVIVKSVRHWRTGKPIYPVKAKALAFRPKRPKK